MCRRRLENKTRVLDDVNDDDVFAAIRHREDTVAIGQVNFFLQTAETQLITPTAATKQGFIVVDKWSSVLIMFSSVSVQ